MELRGDRSYPHELAEESDLIDLRRAISHAQGNNPTRRIRAVLNRPRGLSINELGDILQGEES